MKQKKQFHALLYSYLNIFLKNKMQEHVVVWFISVKHDTNRGNRKETTQREFLMIY